MLPLDDTGVPLTSALAAFSSRRDADGSLDADSMLEQLPFRTLIELLPQTDRPAVCSMDLSRAACTHARLRRFVADEVCFSDYGVGRNDRVAILFPNGPELAVAFVAVLSYCTSAPLNPANTPQEIKAELENVRAKAIMVAAGEDNDGILAVAEVSPTLGPRREHVEGCRDSVLRTPCAGARARRPRPWPEAGRGQVASWFGQGEAKIFMANPSST